MTELRERLERSRRTAIVLTTGTVVAGLASILMPRVANSLGNPLSDLHNIANGIGVIISAAITERYIFKYPVQIRRRINAGYPTE